jgi:hypothetical protein
LCQPNAQVLRNNTYRAIPANDTAAAISSTRYVASLYCTISCDATFTSSALFCRYGTPHAIDNDSELLGSQHNKLARGATDELKSGGYLALIARLATMERGASAAPIFCAYNKLHFLVEIGYLGKNVLGLSYG